MKSIMLAVAVALLAGVGASAANFPYIRLNNQTNRISDNGTALTRDGVAIGGGTGTVGTMINTGTPAVGAISKASDVTGTNWTPSKLTIASDTINWPTNITSGITLSMPSQSGVATNLPWNMVRFSVDNGDGTFNELLQLGYNIGAGGTRLSTNDTALAWAMEGSYLGLTEMHLAFTDLTNTTTRLDSWTIAKTDPANWTRYMTLADFQLRDAGNVASNHPAFFDVRPDKISFSSTNANKLGRALVLTDDGSQVIWQRYPGNTNTLGDFLMDGTVGWRNMNLPALALTPVNATVNGQLFVKANAGLSVYNTGSSVKGFTVGSDVGSAFLSSGYGLFWSSSSTDAFGGHYTGIKRKTTGSLEFDNVDTGGSADIYIQSLYTTGNYFGSAVKQLTSGALASFLYIPLATLNAAGGDVIWEVICKDATDIQSQSGRTRFDGVAKGTAVTATMTSWTNSVALTGGSTLTVDIAANTATNNVLAIGATATTSLTTTNLVIKWRLETPSTFTVNAL